MSVYDVTIGYKYRCPSFLDNVFGVDPSEVHIHICRFPIDCIPTSEDEISTWLMDRFRFKDRLLYNFQFQGQFPDQAKERDLPAVKGILNCVTVIILTGLCMYFTFSSVWFKLYVSVVVAYLVPATYFNIQPQPILGVFKMWLNCTSQILEYMMSLRFLSDFSCNINIVIISVPKIVSLALMLENVSPNVVIFESCKPYEFKVKTRNIGFVSLLCSTIFPNRQIWIRNSQSLFFLCICISLEECWSFPNLPFMLSF